jgi:biotin carboxylase
MNKSKTDHSRPRILMLLPKDSYRNEDYLSAADMLGIEVIRATNQCHQLAGYWGLDNLLALPFDEPVRAAQLVLEHLAGVRPACVLGVDDQGIEAAAAISAALKLKGNMPSAVSRLRDKYRFRLLQQNLGLPAPWVKPILLENAGRAACAEATYPCVIKPTRMSGSRGVIRANDAEHLERAMTRVRRIVGRESDAPAARMLLLEQYLPGSEHALEGLMRQGRLVTLAVFDKPEALEGPFFEERMYVTPSRQQQELQDTFAVQVEQMCRKAGVLDGPVHAEARIHDGVVTLLEVAPRSIGGLCARVLTHSLGMSLEELILRHVTGDDVSVTLKCDMASGVLMIPVPCSGVFHAIEGVEEVLGIDGIERIDVTARPGDVVEPLPEASTYLGFIFARGATAEKVEQVLTRAFNSLAITIQPLLDVNAASG